MGKANIVRCIIIASVFAIGLGSYALTQKPDGVVEQVAEAVLRTQGIDVDLSPEVSK